MEGNPGPEVSCFVSKKTPSGAWLYMAVKEDGSCSAWLNHAWIQSLSAGMIQSMAGDASCVQSSAHLLDLLCRVQSVEETAAAWEEILQEAAALAGLAVMMES